MDAAAWVVAVLSFAAYAVALQVGPSCADNVGPWSAGAFFAAFVWLALVHDRKGRR